jgi:hypothetical protein
MADPVINRGSREVIVKIPRTALLDTMEDCLEDAMHVLKARRIAVRGEPRVDTYESEHGYRSHPTGWTFTWELAAE